MTRDKLGLRDGQRIRVRATIERYGTSGPQSTYLLRDVVDAETGAELTDHLWIVVGKWAGPGKVDGAPYGLRPGYTIEFDARVTVYRKGYYGRREDVAARAAAPSLDWRLERPTKVRKLDLAEYGGHS